MNLSSLNPQQRAAVTTTEGPLLILAGAGTGKTRVITYRIAYLLSRGVEASSILAVTFTNKAAREMKGRVQQLIGRRDASSVPAISTFHSFGARLLRRHAERLQMRRDFVIYNESEQVGIIRKVLGRISVAGAKPDPLQVLSCLSRFKNGATEIADDDTAALAEHLRAQYDRALRAANAVDYDDLLGLSLRVLAEHPEALAAVRGQYRYVMVDEYQDTNGIQFRLLQALTQEHRNLCVVGDDDQSIYGWRGAEVANLLDLERHFPGVKIVKLEENYRSTNVILKAANAVIRHNVARRAKQLWSRKGEGEKIALHCHADDETEARTLADELQYRHRLKRVPWEDLAVLFRTNQQSRPIETALRAAEIPYRLVGGQSFFDRREVKDFLAYLRVCATPEDEVSLLRIINVPARGLSDVTMCKVLAASAENQTSVYATMQLPGVQEQLTSAARRNLERFVAVIEHARERLRQVGTPNGPASLAAWAAELLSRVEYLEEIRRTEKPSEAAENRVRNIQELMATLDNHAGPPDPCVRLTNFLDELALDRDREDQENHGLVTLITMHSCKGLEFPHVYVVGLEEGLLPHSRSTGQAQTLDEERRLFYVAMTRAMQRLTLSYCTGRKKYGQIVPAHPSRFLLELPSDLVETEADQAKQVVKAEQGRDFFAALRSAI